MVGFLLFCAGIIVGLVGGDIMDRYDVRYCCPRCKWTRGNAVVRHSKELASLGERVKVSRAEVKCWAQEEVPVDIE